MIDFLRGTVTPKDWGAVVGMLGLTALIAGLFVFLVHHKQKEAYAIAKKDNDVVSEDLRHAEKNQREIDALREETKSIEYLVTEFEQRLPSKREIPTLIKEFENMEFEHDIDVEFSPLKRVLDENKETIPYQVVARGNFHNVVNFINQLERFKRFLKVTDLNIENIDKSQIQAQFTLNTYRFVQSKTEVPSG